MCAGSICGSARVGGLLVGLVWVGGGGGGGVGVLHAIAYHCLPIGCRTRNLERRKLREITFRLKRQGPHPQSLVNRSSIGPNGLDFALSAQKYEIEIVLPPSSAKTQVAINSSSNNSE